MRFEAEGREFAKFLGSPEQFIQNSERSEQFLVTKCFSKLFLEVSHIQSIRTIGIQIGKKILGFRNLQEKLETCKSIDFWYAIPMFNTFTGYQIKVPQPCAPYA